MAAKLLSPISAKALHGKISPRYIDKQLGVRDSTMIVVGDQYMCYSVKEAYEARKPFNSAATSLLRRAFPQSNTKIFGNAVVIDQADVHAVLKQKGEW
jgi:hypothetical protein